MSGKSPQPPHGLLIGDAARETGVSAANIRYYEREGLLAPQTRAENDYRLYAPQDLHRLRFIRLCRAMDMSLDEVRTLLALDLRRKDDCTRADAALAGHIGHVRERLAELRALERQLVALHERCQGDGERCRIIEALHAQADDPVDGDAGRPRRHRHV